ncbi:hypothetical protein AGLY_003393 [Aphis glycines]|uniref:Uncharacterized protein n=1 Tax=Aphis glycines TaxID=307491 RepID=A0A6G0U202_APHGL|nr:hypothetical protein AGLY_003393 [Aphis glycines]
MVERGIPIEKLAIFFCFRIFFVDTYRIPIKDMLKRTIKNYRKNNNSTTLEELLLRFWQYYLENLFGEIHKQFKVVIKAVRFLAIKIISFHCSLLYALSPHYLYHCFFQNTSIRSLNVVCYSILNLLIKAGIIRVQMYNLKFNEFSKITLIVVKILIIFMNICIYTQKKKILSETKFAKLFNKYTSKTRYKLN